MSKRAAIAVFLVIFAAVSTSAQRVRLTVKDAESRVDVAVDGKLFTSYRWDEKIRRPVLLPVVTAGGATITRGFPVETRDGETIDHPHQVGLAMSYGDVNGVDFWNNSPFRSAAELDRMGRIVHRRVIRVKSGNQSGELVTESDWLMPDGTTVLTAVTRYEFIFIGKIRLIDVETKLTAKSAKVVFGDNKEGFFALRVARELEQIDQFPVKITDLKGVFGEAKNGANLTGEYFTSEGVKGNAVWGTTGKWAAITGRIGGEDIAVAIFDDPKNLNHPASMMVRGYGLLALNPFGRTAFDPKSDARSLNLDKGRSVRLRYRLAIANDKSALEENYREFVK